MGRNLHVDPVDIHLSAGHVDVAADDLRTAHGTAYSNIADAHGSWVGTSAGALAAKAAEWETRSAGHYETMVGYGSDLRSAAAVYVGTDSRSAAEVKAVADNMGL